MLLYSLCSLEDLNALLAEIRVFFYKYLVHTMQWFSIVEYQALLKIKVPNLGDNCLQENICRACLLPLIRQMGKVLHGYAEKHQTSVIFVYYGILIVRDQDWCV